jgi:two-component system response regulator ChvI
LLQAPSTTQPKKIFEKTAILIVDDEPDILRVLKKSLEDDGYEVYGFTHPVAALEHLKDNPEYYSVLISDIRMPGMSGFELARTVRSLNSKIKIILMTAFEVNMSEFVKVLPSIKIDALLHKPFKITRVQEVLEKTIHEPISLG